MGKWYRPATPSDDRLWVYSERGLMSYAFVVKYMDHPDLLLDRAINGSGQTLGQHLGGGSLQHRLVAEFSLGKDGFGFPDGGLFLRNTVNDEQSFVFIEAKTQPWVVVTQQPETKSAAELSFLSASQLNDVCQRNAFNSKLNGQLELRWRFVNAFRRSASIGNPLVTEANDLPPELMNSDRFYWRKNLCPVLSKKGHWRRVNMEDDLSPLHQAFLTVGDRFFLLAITADQRRPPLETVRMFDLNGTALGDAEKSARIFWLPFNSLSDLMEEVPVLAGAECRDTSTAQ